MKIEYIIPIVALLALIGHLFVPGITLDLISVFLIIIAMTPWIPKLLESAKLPGGWELKFRNLEQHVSDVEEAVNPLVESMTESESNESDATQIHARSEEDLKILNALTDSRFTLRSTSGVAKSSGNDRQIISKRLMELAGEGLVARVEGKKGIRWALTSEGRDLIDDA